MDHHDRQQDYGMDYLRAQSPGTENIPLHASISPGGHLRCVCLVEGKE